ncbi:MAG: molecular chaperone TorD family protein, partial [Bacteroidota bacterium]
MNASSSEPELRKALCRSRIYKLMAKSFLYPTYDVVESIFSPSQEDVLSEYAILGDQPTDTQESIKAFREILSSWSSSQKHEELQHEYNRLFAHLGSAKCPPYETEYGYDNVFQKTEAMADIAGFYNAFGLGVREENSERVDFISMELEFMSYLALKEAYAREHGEEKHLEICTDAQRKFVQDHLGRWISIFTKILANSSENTFYLQLGNLTGQFLESEFAYLGVTPSKIMAPSKGTEGKPGEFSCDSCVSPPPVAS